jgi:hypothetical protein
MPESDQSTDLRAKCSSTCGGTATLTTSVLLEGIGMMIASGEPEVNHVNA